MLNFSLELSNWRAFRDKVRMTIKPLTLIYGHNQAGKSSLLRSLPLLADTIFSDAGPMNIDSIAMAGANFADMGWRRKGYPGWGVSVGQGQDAATLTSSFSNEDGMIVNTFNLFQPQPNGKKHDEFLVDWESTEQRFARGGLRARYAGTHGRADWHGELTFNQFFPEGLPQTAQQRMEPIRSALNVLAKIQWLQANRGNHLLAGPQKIRCCAADGRDLPHIMAAPSMGRILGNVAQWCSERGSIADQLLVREDGRGVPDFWLQRQGLVEMPLHLAGEGVRALLPVLLCAAWADASRDISNFSPQGPSLLAIEEPESHLHPDWQIALFDRLLTSIQKGTPIVLETHSVHILRAMQLAVLEGRITADDIALYWVEQDKEGIAKLVPIEVKPDATLPEWRAEVFETEQELAHKILDLRWKKAGQGS